jgi:hypothetical protein
LESSNSEEVFSVSQDKLMLNVVGTRR